MYVLIIQAMKIGKNQESGGWIGVSKSCSEDVDLFIVRYMFYFHHQYLSARLQYKTYLFEKPCLILEIVGTVHS